MANFIWLIPAFPLISFLIISIFGKHIPKGAIAWLGVGSVALSALLTIITGIDFLSHKSYGSAWTSVLYTWLNAGGFKASVSFLLDPLSLIFCFVITFVGTLIHLYSVEFMKEDEGFSRFFAYMNLFVSSMLILVLADNLLLLYLGWEGVGLCSYLLIGFWYKEPQNGYAARKAFIVTRIGDTAMILGLFLLYVNLGTLDIQELMQRSSGRWIPGDPVAVAAAALLLGGALGKSAQLPLQTWLPDAMAGPSPVSALIHAATMVTAGVYLITRTHVLFSLAPVVMTAIAVIGAATLLIAGFSALAQTDLKRILAYSTISQIGYMFLALGIGAWTAAVFHFMMHAFFKALLFLSGGAVIHVLNDEHDIFRMGGLSKKTPVLFITFLAGAASLAALPLVTAGFYSKDEILWLSWSASGNHWMWFAGITGSLLTSLYIFRLVFIVFFGEIKTEPGHKAGILITVPLIILAFFSISGGFIEIPENIAPVHLLKGVFAQILPDVNVLDNKLSETLLQIIAAVISIGGIFLAWKLFFRRPAVAIKFMEGRMNRFFLSGWGFDRLYDMIVVRPFIWLSSINKNDFIDKFSDYVTVIAGWMNHYLSLTQNGRMRWYVLVLTAGIVILLTVMISL